MYTANVKSKLEIGIRFTFLFVAVIYEENPFLMKFVCYLVVSSRDKNL